MHIEENMAFVARMVTWCRHAPRDNECGHRSFAAPSKGKNGSYVKTPTYLVQ